MLNFLSEFFVSHKQETSPKINVTFLLPSNTKVEVTYFNYRGGITTSSKQEVVLGNLHPNLQRELTEKGIANYSGGCETCGSGQQYKII